MQPIAGVLPQNSSFWFVRHWCVICHSNNPEGQVVWSPAPLIGFTGESVEPALKEPGIGA